MKIKILSKAAKKLKKLPKLDQIAIARKIRSLPSATQEERLKGYEQIFRVRVGDYRIVYKKTAEEIIIIIIGHRKEVYRLFRNLLK